MSPYTYPELQSLIESANKLLTTGRKVWLYRWGMLSVLFDYLTRAEAQVRVQEKNLTLLYKYGHKNHKKYSDRLHQMISSTVSTYEFIYSCIKIADHLKRLSKYHDWIFTIAEKRNRFSSHPDEKSRGEIKGAIVSYGISSFSSTGEVRIRIVDLEEKVDTYNYYKNLTLNPRKDHEILKEYIKEFSTELKAVWDL